MTIDQGEFKLVKLRLKTNLVAHPARVEGRVNTYPSDTFFIYTDTNIVASL